MLEFVLNILEKDIIFMHQVQKVNSNCSSKTGAERASSVDWYLSCLALWWRGGVQFGTPPRF